MTPKTHIVTGEINAGKTARMRELFLQTSAADGLLSEKIFQNGCFQGYRLVHLKSGEARTLALREEAYCGQFAQACQLGPFVFSAEAFRFGTRILKRLCADARVEALFLDEAGPLELRGQGFAEALSAMMRAEKAVYVAVRSGCLREFLIKYRIADYHLVPVPDGKSPEKGA